MTFSVPSPSRRPLLTFKRLFAERTTLADLPKGPFRTKNTTTIVKIVNYYAVVFLLRPPNLVRSGPFFERKNVCNSQRGPLGRETDGIAAKLLRCGIASEALRQNMPLSQTGGPKTEENVLLAVGVFFCVQLSSLLTVP